MPAKHRYQLRVKTRVKKRGARVDFGPVLIKREKKQNSKQQKKTRRTQQISLDTTVASTRYSDVFQKAKQASQSIGVSDAYLVPLDNDYSIKKYRPAYERKGKKLDLEPWQLGVDLDPKAGHMFFPRKQKAILGQLFDKGIALDYINYHPGFCLT